MKLLPACLIIAGAIFVQILDTVNLKKVTTPDEDKLIVVGSGKQN